LDIKRVTNIEADKIIETRKPVGLFYVQTEKRTIGIDNSTGEAWTEEFETKEKCIEWLEDTDIHVGD
jgi:hypothetical protein